MTVHKDKKRQTKVVMKGVDREILRKYYVDKIIPYDKYNEMTDIFKPNAVFNTNKITPYKQSLRMKIESGVARNITKALTLNYDKREILADGNTTPF